MTDDATAGSATDAESDATAGTEEPAPGGRAALVEALAVRRNAARGFAFGIGFTVLVFVFFVVVPGVTRSPLYYVALAFTLAMTLGGLATTVLIGRSAYRLSKEL